MVDLLWERVTGRGREIQLAMECEWSTKLDEIAWDFRKLVCLKAVRKLMIFQAPVRNGDADILTMLVDVVRNYRIKQSPAEQYIPIRHKDNRRGPLSFLQL